jgi:hypothetical protein
VTEKLRKLTTPRSAAAAGVLFALLFGAALILIRTSLPEHPDIGTSWLESGRGKIHVAALLLPFAGVTFLWFIGVVRDGFGGFEDKFFSSVFIGSGLLFLAMIFTSSAVGVALTHTSGEMTVFGQMLLLALSKTYALRMAAVFMMSLATIWLKTGLMPRWLVGVTYLVAVGLILASDLTMWLVLAFPAWVLVVSVLLLVKAGVIDLDREH